MSTILRGHYFIQPHFNKEIYVAVIIQFDMDPTLPVGWPDQGQELSRDLLAVSVREEEEEEEEDHPHHLEMRS